MLLLDRWTHLCISLCIGCFYLGCKGDDQPIVAEQRGEPAPEARTITGGLRGKYITLSNGKKVAAFLGIPFAEPPVGTLRFKPPVHRSRWDHVYNATTFGPLCVQSKNRSHWDIVETPEGKKVLRRLGLWDYPQSEDCLNLNIYVPYEAWKSKSNYRGLSVMFFIHGGSYKTNGGRFYPGEWLASAGNVIVITVNYRLGVLGFLSTQDSAAEGNYGLLDQVMALQWVKENIDNFGGNSTDVTIFGNSAGGACVGLHLLSPLSRGLFSKVIAQSGSPIGEWAVQKKPRMYAEQLAEKLDCLDIGNTASMVNCLRTVTIEDILEKSEEAKTLEDSLMLQFAPVVDGKFLLKMPIEMFQQEGSLAQVPTMIGLTRDELEVWMTKSYQDKDPSTIPFTKDLLRKYLMHLVRKEYMSDLAVDVLLHAVYAEYVFRHGTTSSHHKKRKQQQNMNNGTAPYYENPASALPDIRTLGKIISDIDLKAPTIKLANLLSLHTNVSVFMYEFDYASTDDVIVTKYVGSYHESELYYLFGFPHMNLANALRLPEDKEVSNMMILLWSNFAKYGEPTPDANKGGADKSKTFVWTPYTEDEDCFATLGLQPFVARSYESERMVFWNHFIPLFTEYPITSSSNRSHLLTEGCRPEVVVIFSLVSWVLGLLFLGLMIYLCSCRAFRSFGLTIPV